MTDPRILAVKELIELCPDFPKPGILFQNIFPVLRNPSVFKGLIDVLAEDIRAKYPAVEVIVGLDSRGFLFGPMIAQELNVAFVPVRKKGKLPGETHRVEYSLEYGKDSCEIQKNSLQPGQKVVIVDDLLATGGTMKAACDLMEAAKVEVLACLVVIELKVLKGKDQIKYPLLSYIE
ncbi:adenine phosphoribosyltransferase-like [Ruditapes philippinarum]|uniref:adenine phosphoribosyltransferase-like n=1 Tax=Ruditapes philippinarum TaxID=129788 RepID=UPI00295BACF7|nr:adenine phosphoribosyltransferase-like [Ruditapes philippinarum]